MSAAALDLAEPLLQPARPRSTMRATHVFGLLCAINLLNFIDRGVIPGAPIEFQAFVQASYGVAPSHVSVYVGLLASAFIASYSISICIFGYLSMTHRPFVLAAIGLFVWVGALLLCGLAKPCDSFLLLLVGRLFSGIGESSFHATTPAFIDEFAPRSRRTLWLGCFYAGMPAGTAIGYSYGSIMAQTLGWDVAFYALGIAMLPLAYMCWAWIPPEFNHPLRAIVPKCHHDDDDDDDDDSGVTADVTDTELTPRRSDASPASAEAIEVDGDEDDGLLLQETHGTAPPPLCAEVLAIVHDLLFVSASLGLAAFAFTIAGLGAFAPSILIGYGLLDAATAPTVFGALVVVTGVLGSPIGGILLDRSCRTRPDDAPYRVYMAATQMLAFLAVGTVCLFVSMAYLATPWAFFLLQALGLFALFAAQAATTLVILLSVSRARRGFAMGLNTLVLHVLGDVPSPIVLGALKDRWAPRCGSVVLPDGALALDPACVLDTPGLTKTLLFAYSWLLLAVVAWIGTYAVAKRRLRCTDLVPCGSPTAHL
ncbi:hypothetical protein SPRG_18887 [Saprolegnia parasitica CBS 223.65]|uniref:Major facilitator superfamily (MFS) profile domain-containing protein n=1 Tax=Saprolegnia parasitica (strain CBS 223.65) TaxID=695850 RepID=A0A067DAV1_SAPPC|nr:hypothetical protein SPRG_18887 [Saprolegnia parasitica CBS 223.65]KDO35741.1 hypothetical protein SPRG_18887 [Saprolegnia parasitica CBS 223.65]|eukprot:XP_012194101.1 hypothetical protein SPRG_18887 [Saprolegnia parasitica CBS 223.65]